MSTIVELRADNFARLRAVEIRPDGSLVVVSGKNGQGKTSVLNAIWTCLKGRAAAPPVPIRQGAEEARIRLDLGEMVVLRTFKKDAHGDLTTDLKVTMADGSRVTRTPQAMIDAMLGDLTFDPLAFAKAPPKEQFETLRALVAGFDFDANAAERQEVFEQRTTVNRVAGQHRAAAEQIKLPPGQIPEKKEPSAGAMVDELTAALAFNSQNGKERARRVGIEVKAADVLDEAERMRARASSMEREAEEQQARIAALPPIPDEVDVAPIRAKIAGVEQAQAAWRLAQRRRENELKAAELEETSKALTGKLLALDRRKIEALATAKLPAGLALNENDAVLLGGVPFQQAGTAEKLVASTQVAMALNPSIKVVLVDEGSELDSEHLGMVARLAAEKGYQVWVARVDETGEVGFVIEDGALARRREAAE